MSKEQLEIESEIIQERGVAETRGAKANACSRICGLLFRQGRDWDKAFEHISDHFHTLPEKEGPHTLFHPKYRSKEALRHLLLCTASRPSHVRLTKLHVRKQPIGRPAIKIVRDFGHQVGENPGQTRVRIFVDFEGRLITAYPG